MGTQNQTNTNFYKIFQDLNFGEFHVKEDKKTGLTAIIAIHSTKRGPALGGCRCVPYPNIEAAIIDSLRLAQGMSYKAALSELPLGGGKAVIMCPKTIPDRKAFFEAFGRFVNELNGKYITAEDSGTCVADMDLIRTQTPYVVGDSDPYFETKDPSVLTAFGVRRGIEAAVKYRLNKESLEGIHVLIQGVGNVGYVLAKELHALGAKLTVSDINQKAVDRCIQEFSAQSVSPDKIHEITCDVYSPCALGGAINPKTIDKLKAPIIAGAANNQLSSIDLANTLQQKEILYAPDYVVNAGGLIHVSAKFTKHTENQAREQVSRIYETLLNIFDQATKTEQSTTTIANKVAETRLNT